ncbi:hypothetical protein CBS101457_004726 [Exobasidium rhododendri]|nr:hypothetical protein CBS101457_004726 [Exobasidium rhododendri]
MVRQLPVLTGNTLKGRTLTALIALVSGVGFMLFGYDQGVMSGLFSAGQFSADFPLLADVLPGAPANPHSSPTNPRFNSNIQGAVTAIYEIGALFGSLIVLWKGDAMGRRTSICIGACTMIVGAIIMSSAGCGGHQSQSARLATFTSGRIITGIGNGINTSTIPMWQSELSKAHNRGLLVLVEGALIAGGIMIAYWVDYGFYWLDTSSVQWRFPIAFQAAFAVVVLIGIFCLPESPRWLIKKGHYHQAAGVLAQMDNTSIDDVQVQLTLQQLQDAIGDAEAKLGNFSYRELFTNGPEQNFYRTSIAFVAQAFQQLSGINLVTYYATTIFLSIVPEAKTARLLTCGNGTEYFLASIVALFLIDTLGRRKLMLGTAFMMSVSMAILAGAVSVVNAKAAQGITGVAESYVAAFFLYFFNTMFAFGWLGMTWLYPPEITPIRIRAPASAIATSSNWLFNFLIVMITPPAFATIGYRTYIIFAVLNLSFLPIIYILFPETKRRSLEELDIIFAEAHDEGNGKFFMWNKFMTTACHLSLTKRHLTTEELDEELAKRFGASKVMPSKPVSTVSTEDKEDKAIADFEEKVQSSLADSRH